MKSKNLKKSRNKLGLNVKEMAIALNTPYGTYRKWESGERRVPGIIEIALKALPRKTNKKTPQQILSEMTIFEIDMLISVIELNLNIFGDNENWIY